EWSAISFVAAAGEGMVAPHAVSAPAATHPNRALQRALPKKQAVIVPSSKRRGTDVAEIASVDSSFFGGPLRSLTVELQIRNEERRSPGDALLAADEAPQGDDGRGVEHDEGPREDAEPTHIPPERGRPIEDGLARQKHLRKCDARTRSVGHRTRDR